MTQQRRKRISAETRAAIAADLQRLSKRPTFKDATELGKKHGVGGHTVWRTWSDVVVKGRLPATGPAPAGKAQAKVAGRITVEPSTLPVEELPQLTAGAQPPPPGGGSHLPPPGAPAVAPMLDAKPMVDVLCDLFDRRASAPIDGSPDKTPKPPEPISREEREHLAAAWAAMVGKHGGAVAAHAVELNALFITLAVFGPRLAAYSSYHQYHRQRAHEEAMMQMEGQAYARAEPRAPEEPDAEVAKRAIARLKNMDDTSSGAYA